ncbi:MAG: hypothetical protein UU95_C0039G0010 [Parcubacteria group bacterium GW2011_GWC2_42_12]|nr:MAG: hypothetical protein UU43_C0001G0133 [Candidatus Falkowbacteria bacterium GW2011_GWA2_41_14]KKS33143.1 MAG: hypothetical protein UU95_C0039G0010 [Parcubacteria group bacterium GW2011_GWC2_42_12]
MNWKKWTIAGLTAIAVVVAAGYIFHQIPWFWKYWTMIGLAVIALGVLTVKHNSTRKYLGMMAGQLCSNNNWRWGALFILAVIFSISAMLAGFGRPLLTSSAKEVRSSITERLDNYPQAKAEMRSLFWGTNSAPSVFTPSRVIEKKYSSWWHWIWAGFLWFAWVVYTPFAFRDEAMKAIKAAIKAVELRKRLNQIREGSVVSAIVTPTPGAPAPAVAITKADLLKKVFQVQVFWEFLEIFVKLLLKKTGNLFK